MPFAGVQLGSSQIHLVNYLSLIGGDALGMANFLLELACAFNINFVYVVDCFDRARDLLANS